MKIKAAIGTSGFGIARSKYVQTFSCVEVQHTFYQPPKISTLERWRHEAPPNFEFVMKAWQLITHDARSSTYRRLKKQLSEREKQEAGYFRATPIVNEAWEVTLACANALRARTILFQCPASFKQTVENMENLKVFFGKLNRETSRSRFNFCWEPRGDWDPKEVKRICNDLKLWHVVDPFQAVSVTPRNCYFRLHGRGGWKYEYEDAELRELAAMLPRRSTKSKPTYVFFNNVRMTQDALKFEAITREA
ncbi:MAG TPA: DUF72 domain-containing protein [Pyrinomonadaceae bacterium]|nr:DUF72 domain-containing protein [Pyrinomonadaceae bacterium]